MRVGMQYTEIASTTSGILYYSDFSAAEIFDAISDGEHIVFAFYDGPYTDRCVSMLGANSRYYVYTALPGAMYDYDGRLCITQEIAS